MQPQKYVYQFASVFFNRIKRMLFSAILCWKQVLIIKIWHMRCKGQDTSGSQKFIKLKHKAVTVMSLYFWPHFSNQSFWKYCSPAFSMPELLRHWQAVSLFPYRMHDLVDARTVLLYLMRVNGNYVNNGFTQLRKKGSRKTF